MRPAGAAAGDQKRVMTPAQARAAGADLVVVGRPLRDASDPAAAARAIVAELGVVSGPGERVVYGAGPVRELIARAVRRSVRALWVDPQRAGRSTSDPVAAHRDRGARGRRSSSRIAIATRSIARPARARVTRAWSRGSARSATPTSRTSSTRATSPRSLVALDGVEDPRNLGAILRSAYLLGARGVIIPDHRAAQVTSIVAKASAGASELLPIAQVGNLVRALEQLRELGLWRVAVHASETRSRSPRSTARCRCASCSAPRAPASVRWSRRTATSTR